MGGEKGFAWGISLVDIGCLDFWVLEVFLWKYLRRKQDFETWRKKVDESKPL
jgi:hypothetical protein